LGSAKYDYVKYKGRLIEYLRARGYKIEREGLIRCFSPHHEDKNPSCQITEDAFYCHSGNCGINGDIYDAIEILEGITDRAEQYKFAEKFFHDEPVNFRPLPKKPESPPVEETEDFARDEEADKIFETCLKKNKATEKAVRQFLKTRAQVTSQGKLKDYPDDVMPYFLDKLLYWPGYDMAK
jgi:hypothetical protein